MSLYNNKVYAGLILLLWAMPVYAGSVNVKQLLTQTWTSVESERFSVLSNADEKNINAMLEELEHFNYFLSEVLSFGQPQLKQKIPIILVDNERTYRALGMPRDYVGIFLGRDGGVIFARADKFRAANAGRNWGRLVVLHELAHLLMNASENGRISSPWFNEGFAEYLGTFQTKNKQIVIGELAALKTGFYSMETRSGRYESVDTESLFNITQEELRIGQNNSREHYLFVDKFYARSAAVVHYLDADEERRKQMYQYLDLIDSGVSVDDAFEEAFVMDFVDLDKKVDRYVRRNLLRPRRFKLGENGVNFPAISKINTAISERAAMSVIYSKLSLFDDAFLGEGGRINMERDFETHFPGMLDP